MGLGFGVWGLGIGVWVLGFEYWGLGIEVWVLGFGVSDFRFEVWGFSCTCDDVICVAAGADARHPLPESKGDLSA